MSAYFHTDKQATAATACKYSARNMCVRAYVCTRARVSACVHKCVLCVRACACVCMLVRVRVVCVRVGVSLRLLSSVTY